MKKTYRSYGCSASIAEHRDGTATLKVRDSFGKLIRNSEHKNFKAAEAAWRRMCN